MSQLISYSLTRLKYEENLINSFTFNTALQQANEFVCVELITHRWSFPCYEIISLNETKNGFLVVIFYQQTCSFRILNNYSLYRIHVILLHTESRVN